MGFWGSNLAENDTAEDAIGAVGRRLMEGVSVEEAVSLGEADLVGVDSDIQDRFFFLVGAIRAIRMHCEEVPQPLVRRLKSTGAELRRSLPRAEREPFGSAFSLFLREPTAEQVVTRDSRGQQGLRRFGLGDCLSVVIDTASFAGLFVVTARCEPSGEEWYRLVPLAGVFSEPPSAEIFARRLWRIEDRSAMRESIARDKFAAFKGMRVEDWPDRPQHMWCEVRDLHRHAGLFDLVGRLDLKADDPAVAPDAVIGEHFGSVEALIHMLR